MRSPADVRRGPCWYKNQLQRRQPVLAEAKDRPSTPRAVEATNVWNQGAGESADASAHREKTSLSSQRSAEKCVSSTTSTVTSSVPAHRLPIATASRKGAPCPKPLASPAGPPVVRKTCRPSLTAAPQQALHKVYHRDHRCPRRRHVREPAAAERSDTSHPRR